MYDAGHDYNTCQEQDIFPDLQYVRMLYNLLRDF